MSLLLGICLVGVWAAVDYAPEASLVEQYQPGEYNYSDDKVEFIVHYRLHVPPELKAGERYPLLIWLHGFGEQGADNKEHLRWLDLVAKTAPHPNYYCLALQCPEGEMWYRVPDKIQPDDMSTITIELLDKLSAKHPIDSERVYLAGVSSGGGACWETAMRYPQRFAAVVPMSSSGGDHSRLERITHLPIWAFNSVTDGVSPEPVERAVSELNRLGGNSHLTLVNNKELGLKLTHTPGVLVDHDSWTAAFEHYHVMEWLLAQKRGTRAMPPGVRPWASWNYLVIVGIVLLTLAALVAARRRLHRSPVRSSYTVESATGA